MGVRGHAESEACVEAIEFVKPLVLAIPTHTCGGKDGDASHAHHIPPGLWTMSRGSASSTVGGGVAAGRELAARLAPCLHGHFPRIVPLLRLDQMDGDNQHFAHDCHDRHALFHATSHQALVVSPKGGCLQADAP